MTLMIALGAYFIGIGMPETYARAVKPRAAKYRGLPAPHIPKALSGTTLTGMLQTTLFTPLRMLVVEPIVIGISLYLGFNFAVVFSFFIAVPVVLNLIYDFTIQQSGLAFLAAIGGSLVAAATTICIDKLVTRKTTGVNMVESHGHSLAAIEYRLLPAMIGGPAITASLFWIGWEASPTTSAYSPILGTALYVWGNMCVLVSQLSSHHSLSILTMSQISGVSYLFDAYPAKGTLSGLTSAACTRLVLAGVLPLVIIQSQCAAPDVFAKE